MNHFTSPSRATRSINVVRIDFPNLPTSLEHGVLTLEGEGVWAIALLLDQLVGVVGEHGVSPQELVHLNFVYVSVDVRVANLSGTNEKHEEDSREMRDKNLMK